MKLRNYKILNVKLAIFLEINDWYLPFCLAVYIARQHVRQIFICFKIGLVQFGNTTLIVRLTSCICFDLRIADMTAVAPPVVCSQQRGFWHR